MQVDAIVEKGHNIQEYPQYTMWSNPFTHWKLLDMLIRHIASTIMMERVQMMMCPNDDDFIVTFLTHMTGQPVQQ